MSRVLNQNGVYAFGCFSPSVRAVFSGREVTREQFQSFADKADFAKRKLVLVHQVHGSEVLCVTKDKVPEAHIEADGLLTDSPAVVLGIKTADCLPVLFEDPVRQVVGAVHAGWRGLHAGVIEQALSKMAECYGSSPSDVRAAIGPAIRGCCYEVGPEFRDYFPGFYSPGRSSGSEPGGMFNPVQAAISRLQSAGLRPERIYDSGLCTVCRMDSFYSFRGEKTGERILSLIAMGLG